MKIDPALAREALSPGPPTTPRPSASVILLREGPHELELVLVQRSPEQRFMGGIWVFPGGAVDAADGEGDAARRAAAVRELREEAGVCPVLPRVVRSGDTARIVLPGEPGYEDA